MEKQTYDPISFMVSMRTNGTFTVAVVDRDFINSPGSGDPFYLKEQVIRFATDATLVPLHMTTTDKGMYRNRGKIKAVKGLYKPLDFKVNMYKSGNFEIVNLDPNITGPDLVKHVTAFALSIVPINDRITIPPAPNPDTPKKTRKQP